MSFTLSLRGPQGPSFARSGLRMGVRGSSQSCFRAHFGADAFTGRVAFHRDRSAKGENDAALKFSPFLLPEANSRDSVRVARCCCSARRQDGGAVGIGEVNPLPIRNAQIPNRNLDESLRLI